MLFIKRSSIFLLIIAVAFLVGLGLIMLGSTSPWVEPESMRYSHLKRQTIFLIIGIIGAVMAGAIPLKFYERFNWWIFGITVISLILCFIPPFEHPVNGSNRWIKMPLITRFQPSEVSKIAISIMLAWWMVNIAKDKPTSFWKGYFLPLTITAIPAGLVLLEIDMGTTAVICGSALLALYLAGSRGWLLILTAITGVLGLIGYVNIKGGNRQMRLTAFMNPEDHKLDFGLQQWRSILAFANGGINGTGLGNGAEKHGYLPYAHTDFIFPIIGEELGLKATLCVILAFVFITISGILIAFQSHTRFGRILAISLTGNIVIPGVMNIAVATSMLPNTGLPLPFMSFGGTNLIFSLISVGMLISIYLRSPDEENPFVKRRRERRLMRV